MLFSKRIFTSLLLIILYSFVSSSALAERPAKGEFDYLKFRGLYKFSECEFVGKDPIWSYNPENTFIRMTVSFTRRPYTLMMTLFEPGKPLGLNWTFYEINEGPYQKRNRQTGEVTGEYEDYTTPDGVYRQMKWWFEGQAETATMHVTMNKRGQVSYHQTLQRRYDSILRQETCTLERVE